MDMQKRKPKPQAKVVAQRCVPRLSISDKDRAIIEREYATGKLADITAKTGISRHRLHRIAAILGLERTVERKLPVGRVRTKERRDQIDAAIRERYATTDNAELAAELGEDVRYIINRAWSLGIGKEQPCPSSLLSESVRNLIEMEYPRGNLSTLCRTTRLSRQRLHRIAEEMGLERELDSQGRQIDPGDRRTCLTIVERKGYTVRRHAAL